MTMLEIQKDISLWVLASFLFLESSVSAEWITWGSSQYSIVNISTTWSNARYRCENDKNAKLAVITTEEENDYLKSMLVDNWRYWIGLRQGNLSCTCYYDNVCKTCRESWTWYDNTEMNFIQWDNYQPWNYGCGRLQQSGWESGYCNSDRYFICEKDLCDSLNCNYGYCKARNGFAQCYCNNGYTGPYCNTDIDECQRDRPCHNGASCNNTEGNYTCICAQGWEGTHCDTDSNECLSNPCTNNGTCIDKVNSYHCQCTDEYEGSRCEIESRNDEDSRPLTNRKKRDLVISLCVGAVLAAISMIVLVVMLVLDIRDSKRANT